MTKKKKNFFFVHMKNFQTLKFNEKKEKLGSFFDI